MTHITVVSGNVERLNMEKLFLYLLIVLVCGSAHAQIQLQPIIDVHLHCAPADWNESNTPINPVTGLPSTATMGKDLLPKTLLEMDKHNIVLALLSGPLENIREWQSEAPDRFLVGPQFPMTHKSDLSIRKYWPNDKELQNDLESGKIKVIGEITAQYAGMIPGDTLLDHYFALAQEFDLPVGIHTGNGTISILNSDEARRKYRVEYGNPLYVNSVLAKYPNIRIYLMHAGYPFLEDAIALMKVYRNVYADLSRMNWASATRIAFHDYLKSLIDAGLGDRLMFGSDGLGLPEAIELAIEGINSAEFLTEKQKQDIFYNNAARFLRLSEKQIAEHHKNKQKATNKR